MEYGGTNYGLPANKVKVIFLGFLPSVMLNPLYGVPHQIWELSTTWLPKLVTQTSNQLNVELYQNNT